MYRELLADGNGRVLELDRYPGRPVDLIADAHHLPIRDGVAGFTVLVEVLEHLMEPAAAL